MNRDLTFWLQKYKWNRTHVSNDSVICQPDKWISVSGVPVGKCGLWGFQLIIFKLFSSAGKLHLGNCWKLWCSVHHYSVCSETHYPFMFPSDSNPGSWHKIESRNQYLKRHFICAAGPFPDSAADVDPVMSLTITAFKARELVFRCIVPYVLLYHYSFCLQKFCTDKIGRGRKKSNDGVDFALSNSCPTSHLMLNTLKMTVLPIHITNP